MKIFNKSQEIYPLKLQKQSPGGVPKLKENTFVRVLFNKGAGLQPVFSLKRRFCELCIMNQRSLFAKHFRETAYEIRDASMILYCWD